MSPEAAPHTPRFSFLAGRPSLDFANTVDWHASDHPQDRLRDFADLVIWSERAGVLSEPDAQDLLAQGRRRPAEAASTFATALALREALYRAFSGVAAGQGVAPEDLAALTAARRAIACREQLVEDAGAYTWRTDLADAGLDRVWWPLAQDAADLLTSPALQRVRECADDRGCGWLFLDTSPSGRRRWCSMEDCGNRAKALRHRQRTAQRAG